MILFIILVTMATQALSVVTNRTFTIDYELDCYLKDGACYRYIAGEMHYFRIPPDQWTDRLLKLRAAGFDTVQTYIAWNVHVPEDGQVTFEGIADVFRYMDIAQRLGINVIVRPGPYLCTEWDYGGFPAWLLRDRPTLDVRRNETVYMNEVRKWYAKLMPLLVPYLYQNGGPIIAVQVENEFGSNKPCDAAHYDYMFQLKAIYRHYLGDDIVLLTVDGDSYRLAKCGNIEGLYSTVNFGAGGDVAEKFAVQRKQEPHGPYVCSAFFSGWLDHWGHLFNKVSTDRVASSLKDILEFSNRSASVSMYMFHGGTNFGYMQGAKGMYQTGIPEYPEIWGKMTSYDYDAPLSEAGDTTWKYYKLRDVISNYSKVYDVPANTTKGSYGSVKMMKMMTVFDLVHDMPDDLIFRSKYPVAMEEMGQNHGIVVYRTTIPDDITLPADINIELYGDRVYILSPEDGLIALSSRNRPPQHFQATSRELFILTDDNGHSNTGHIRYPYNLYQKGIIGNVSIANKNSTQWSNLTDWSAYQISRYILPSQPFVPNARHSQHLLHKTKQTLLGHNERDGVKLGNSHTPASPPVGYVPALYAALIEDVAHDTFVDTTGWGKGILFVNGYNLGRYWPLAGPQLRLFCPQSYCSTRSHAKSVLMMLELEQTPDDLSVGVVDTPLVDGPYQLSQL